MQNAQPIPLDRLRAALEARYPGAGITVEPWDGGITATITGIGELSAGEATIGIADGSGIDPGRVLLSRLIAKRLMHEDDVPEIADLRKDASTESEGSE